MSVHIPPKMDPDDALKDGPPGYVVKADAATGVPGWAPESGGSGGGSYQHHQGPASAVWTIVHNLGYKPGGITVEDSAHTVIEGGIIDYIDANTLTITFNAPFSGDAYLS